MSEIISPEGVKDLTGLPLDRPAIHRAQSLLEMEAGREFGDGSGLRIKDRRLAAQAVAYQAAWMHAHPEVFSNMDVRQVRQVDLDVRFRDESSSSYLSPLARRALNRLSWRGSRSISVPTTLERRYQAQDPPDHTWEPM